MSQPNPKIDAHIQKLKRWREETEALRAIALSCPVTETMKWGKPCYTVDGKNVFLIHSFNDYCAILFMKGALLKDPKGILVQQTKNTQAARQLRFTSVGEITKRKAAIKACMREAIEVEKAGLEVPLKKTAEFDMPEEFQAKLDELPALKKAFKALTPGRQRGYLLHFSAPKQSKTRASRVEKCVQRIFDGKGLNDQ